MLKDNSKPLFPPPNVVRAKQLKPVIPHKNMDFPSKSSNSPFDVLGKFFTKPIGQYNLAELKVIHSDIKNEINSFKKKFISDHKDYTDIIKSTLRKEKQELVIVEDPQSSIEAYLRNSDEILNRELEMTRTLQKQLRVFKKYIAEEKAFVNKFIKDQENRPNQRFRPTANDQKEDSFEISDTHKLQRVSSGSLILDD